MGVCKTIFPKFHEIPFKKFLATVCNFFSICKLRNCSKGHFVNTLAKGFKNIKVIPQTVTKIRGEKSLYTIKQARFSQIRRLEKNLDLH